MRIDRKKLVNGMIDNNINANCLAQLAGVSRVTISNIRCGKSCSEATAYKIAQVIGVNVVELEE